MSQYLKDLRLDGVDWTYLAQDTDRYHREHGSKSSASTKARQFD
jgi:hypothetical protein